MNLEVDVERLLLAEKSVRAELLAERAPDGYWAGQIGSSPVATAAAVSALVAAHHRDSDDALRESSAGNVQMVEQIVQGDLSELLVESVQWLARRQNPDGGWGDCDGAQSNIAATMLVQAAFRLTGIPAKDADLMDEADQYVTTQGGVAALRRRYGGDKALLASILANCALADMVPWRQVPTLPFELLCLPRRWRRKFPMPAARYAAPIVLAVGRAKFHHDPPRNPITRLIRRSVRTKSLAILEQLQAADDSYLSSPLFTAFVVMSLASIGCQEHPIVERGIEFLLTSVRSDASWSITTNLAVSNTTLALNNLAVERLSPAAAPWRGQHICGELSAHDRPATHDTFWADTASAGETVTDRSIANVITEADQRTEQETAREDAAIFSERCFDWLLKSQRGEPNSLTDVPPGGWAWSDVPGSLPNTPATAGALLALAHWCRRDSVAVRRRTERAASLGVAWLLDMQNEDGGWPTYYRDESALRFDDSGVDVTSQALGALAAWQRQWQGEATLDSPPRRADLNMRIGSAIERALRYLESQQREDGSFIPLWFGNEHQPHEHNPVMGTAQVLSACADLKWLESEMARRAARWLVAAQHTNGGWGPPRAPVDYSGAERDGLRGWRGNEAMAKFCSVEETASAVASLLPLSESDAAFSQAASRGVTWLINAVEQDGQRRPAVVGFNLSKLWYHERLYPLVFAAGALARAAGALAPASPVAAPVN